MSPRPAWKMTHDPSRRTGSRAIAGVAVLLGAVGLLLLMRSELPAFRRYVRMERM